jgi:ribonuclease E
VDVCLSALRSEADFPEFNPYCGAPRRTPHPAVVNTARPGRDPARRTEKFSMANKMLIDAAHPEETRVVVLRGNRVEEFDFESANRRQLRGNIYLAKVTRVEPSLQAAFIDYGGNRHGFLAFSEIHPDYYQIPVADRQALIAEDERAHRAAEAEHENRAGRARPRRRGRSAEQTNETVRSDLVEDRPEPDADDIVLAEAQAVEAEAEKAAFNHPSGSPESADPHHDIGPTHADHETDRGHEPHGDTDHSDLNRTATDDNAEASVSSSEFRDEDRSETSDERQSDIAETRDADVGDNDTHHDDDSNIQSADGEEEEIVESVGGADAMEEVPDRTPRYRRQYKIQEVIKRRQIMLVQVVKEERGTKGAALTTYLSLAGRYSVLMPNTARGGGISRKITNSQDRARLKEAASELEVPEGMGVILRTAGAARTPMEIKRDFEYLLRVWETVRDLTLQSTAPTLVYEEGSLVKRSIRDLYNKDIDEVIVAGDAAYKEAKDFMRMLMPSHAKNVKAYRDPQPVFTRYMIESQLDAMFSPIVQLRSGGYIVLNQTEALVAIDVNSGRATREHHIEDTALKTNLEASEEVARQLRLRDLAGLVVIDFIDMDEKRNNRAVERRLKDALKNDRARIQVGRISHFGLMEMSRQRIRTSVLESSTDKCPTCGGLGHVRSVSSLALQLLRVIDETLLRAGTHNLVVRTGPDVALYILNHKRGHLRDLEQRFQITITVTADTTIGPQQPFIIDKGELVHSPEQAKIIAAQGAAIVPVVEEEPEDDFVAAEDETIDAYESVEVSDAELEAATPDEVADGDQSEARDGGRKRRRRRRRGGRNGDDAREASPARPEIPLAAEAGESPEFEAEHDAPQVVGASDGDDSQPEITNGSAEDANRRRRRRGRRGGRRNRRDRDDQLGTADPAIEHDQPESHQQSNEPVHVDIDRSPSPVETSYAARIEPDIDVQPAQGLAAPTPTETPRRRSTVRERAAVGSDSELSAGPSASPAPAPEPPQPATSESTDPDDGAKPRRTGWWAKRLLGG